MNLTTQTTTLEWMKQLEDICQKAAQDAQAFLYDFDFTGTGQGRTLRVFIDTAQGATIEDCSQVSKLLNEALDTADVIPGGAYHLEVSTPGVDRVLRKSWHFEKVIGKKIWVKTMTPFGELGVQEPTLKNTKQIESVLVKFADDVLTLETKKGNFELPLKSVVNAKVVFELKKNLKP